MTERFIKTAGSAAVESIDYPGFFAVGATPEWVRVPDDIPGIAGQHVGVTGTEPCPCFKCSTTGDNGAHATRYILAPTPVQGSTGVLGVLECSKGHGFLWFATTPEDEK